MPITQPQYHTTNYRVSCLVFWKQTNMLERERM